MITLLNVIPNGNPNGMSNFDTKKLIFMITYEQWNKAIISYFFEDCEPGEIVFLETNAETLSEIAEISNFNISDAPESLKMAVREKAISYKTVLLSKVSPIPWKDYSEEEPPQVAFLALTVFAASLMAAETSVTSHNYHSRFNDMFPQEKKTELFASHNYYGRLNEVLFGELIKGRPSGFDCPEFARCWKHLREWAMDQHSATLYLTEGSSKNRYVWLSRSHCLISMRDRRDIYRFFDERGLTPFSKILDDQLEKDLCDWLQSSRLPKIENYLNASYKKSILSQVRSLLENWTGEIPPEPVQGKRQTPASIKVEIRFDLSKNVEIRYWFPTRGRNQATSCKTNPLGIQDLQPSNLEKWFQLVTDDNGVFWGLRNDLRLQTNDTLRPIIYTLGFSNIWVFRTDPDRYDGWLSERNMQLHEDHLIVFPERFVTEVMGCLRKTSEQEIEEPSPIYVKNKKINWLYLRHTPSKVESISEAELWKLSVESSERIKLIGGLSKKDKNNRRVYLDICPPAVSVPDFGDSDPGTLQIDGQVFAVNKDRIARLDDLGPGIHKLTYKNQTRELQIVSPERALEHCDDTLIASMAADKTSIPTYSEKKIAEVSEAPGVWVAGAKIFGDVSPSPPPTEESSFKTPAHIISSIMKVAIDFKQGEFFVPEWLETVIDYLEDNVAIRVLVEKKLSRYEATALSYKELCRKAGK